MNEENKIKQLYIDYSEAGEGAPASEKTDISVDIENVEGLQEELDSKVSVQRPEIPVNGVYGIAYDLISETYEDKLYPNNPGEYHANTPAFRNQYGNLEAATVDPRTDKEYITRQFFEEHMKINNGETETELSNLYNKIISNEEMVKYIALGQYIAIQTVAFSSMTLKFNPDDLLKCLDITQNPSATKTIYIYWDNGDNSLKRIPLSASMTSIEREAALTWIYNNTNLSAKTVILFGLDKIADNCFNGNFFVNSKTNTQQFSSIYFGSGIKTIGDNCFNNQENTTLTYNVEEVFFSEGLQSIGKNSFVNFASRNDGIITFPKSLQKLDLSIFLNYYLERYTGGVYIATHFPKNFHFTSNKPPYPSLAGGVTWPYYQMNFKILVPKESLAKYNRIFPPEYQQNIDYYISKSDLDSSVLELETNINSLEDRVTQNETDISTLNSKVTQNETDISTFEDRINQNETDINSLNSKVTQNETNINTLEDRVVQNETDLDAFEEDFLKSDDFLSFELTLNIDENNLDVAFSNLATGGIFDWGDGTINRSVGHSYSTPGIYIVKIYKKGTNLFSTSNLGTIEVDSSPTIREMVIKDRITEIREGALYRCSNLQKLTIPFIGDGTGEYPFGYIFGTESFDNTVATDQFTTEGFFAYYIPLSLSTVIITKNINYEKHCPYFHECSNLQKIILSDDTTTIPQFMFYNCKNLLEVNFSNKITRIEHQAFFGCEGLTSIINLENVEYFGEKCFWNCNQIKKLVLPFLGQTIDQSEKIFYLFGDNDNIEEITILKGKIINSAFLGNKNLLIVTLGDEVTEIGGYAFSECSNLIKINIGNGVSTIKTGTFRSCINIKEIIIGKSLSTFEGESFFSANSESHIGPMTLRYNGSLDDWAQINFNSNSGSIWTCQIDKIYMNNELITELNFKTTPIIKQYTFLSTSFPKAKVFISKSVKEIEILAFSGSCEFIMESETPPLIAVGCFGNPQKIIVPSIAAIQNYKTAPGFWSTYYAQFIDCYTLNSELEVMKESLQMYRHRIPIYFLKSNSDGTETEFYTEVSIDMAQSTQYSGGTEEFLTKFGWFDDISQKSALLPILRGFDTRKGASTTIMSGNFVISSQGLWLEMFARDSLGTIQPISIGTISLFPTDNKYRQIPVYEVVIVYTNANGDTPITEWLYPPYNSTKTNIPAEGVSTVSHIVNGVEYTTKTVTYTKNADGITLTPYYVGIRVETGFTPVPLFK